MAEGVYLLAQLLRVSSILADNTDLPDRSLWSARQAVDGWLHLHCEAEKPFENAAGSIAGKSISRELAGYLHAT